MSSTRTLPDIMYTNEHDDFLHTMKKVFTWSRWFGVAGSAHKLWKIWGATLFTLLLVVECGAIYKLFKLLAGWAAFSTGNRSVTARLAGAVFYFTTTTSLLLSWKLSSAWDSISFYWAFVEHKWSLNMPIDEKLKMQMKMVIFGISMFSLLEHITSMTSVVQMDCPLAQLLQQYILSSHAFIILPTDYSLWLAIPLLVLSNIATILYNYQDLLIVLISMGITSRYKRLNQCVAETIGNEVKDNIAMEIQGVYTWRKIREAYVKQAMLVRMIDKWLGSLILLSCFENFYFICLQLLLQFQGTSEAFNKKFYYGISLAWSCIRFSSVVLSAASVNVHSKRALQYIYTCSPGSYNIEVERLQKQLAKDYVALSGMGFFYLEKSTLLQVFGAIITYELILIQFDQKGSVDVSLTVTK